MRPTRIEIEGFASFREKVEIDFSDAELFVLSGPTGSGKSSVIDAMTFAFYGAVPRHGKQATSAVVSKGKNLARVRLDFVLDGAEYTAVRAAKVLSSGNATVNEARLEQGDNVLADGSKDLTAAVEALIGLSFDHFKQCVVLPQGQFQEFLQARPAKRQEMLVELLDLGIYDEIRSRAVQRGGTLLARINVLEADLEERYGDVSAEAIAEAQAWHARVSELATRLKERRQDLENRARAAKEAAEEAERLGAQTNSLESLTVPAGIAELAERLQGAKQALETARTVWDAAESAYSEAIEKREELGEKASREALLEKYAGLEKREARVPQLEERVAHARQAAERARKGDAEPSERVAMAIRRFDEAKDRSAAAALAASLSEGSTCPVCFMTIDELPEHDVEDDFEAMEADVERLRRTEAEARKKVTSAAAEVAAAESARKEAQAEIRALGDELKDAPKPKELAEQIESITAAEVAREGAKKAHDAAKTAHRAAEKKRKSLQVDQDEAWTAFEDARDCVAGLGPPRKTVGDLSSSWDALATWGAETLIEVRDQRERAAKRRNDATASEKELLTAIRTQLDEARIEHAEDQSPFDAVDDARASAKTEVLRLQEALKEAARKYGELEEARVRYRTAEELAKLLQATRFKRWLLGRALRSLTRAGTTILHELTSRAYSLTVDEHNEFAVIDHLNADEERAAATLSGGETFLASLALALALADQVSQLAAKGSSKLEALFLDEGFGTLDAETLDVVAATLEELGAEGRMIGVITHVRELADRLPVRYELLKEGNVSFVNRVA